MPSRPQAGRVYGARSASIVRFHQAGRETDQHADEVLWGTTRASHEGEVQGASDRSVRPEESPMQAEATGSGYGAGERAG
ncbi:hypothetical protein GCM10011578_014630 [Streptomyces fuscichromogenes]|uniref:Uncharacterized protein n=1 Tax=Streptomyces fuscichromogenes TaxID=1324013 RepID=A0A917UHL3_9ACTN|nr:hypothetical protein GCM10011578_014630 [Streptomyces fuscichromogenes]